MQKQADFHDIISKNKVIYDFTLTSSNGYDSCAMKLTREDKDLEYEFYGNHTNLIDFHAKWGIFDSLNEACENIRDCIKTKKTEVDISLEKENQLTLFIPFYMNSKSVLLPIKFKIANKVPNISKDDSPDEKIIILEKRIIELEKSLERYSRKRVEHLADIKKQAWHWIVPNEKYEYDYFPQHSGNVEFTVDLQLSFNHANNAWLNVELELHNRSLDEKTNLLMFSHHTYAVTYGCHPMMPPLSLKRVVSLKKGDYKVTVKFDTPANSYLLSSIVCFTERC